MLARDTQESSRIATALSPERTACLWHALDRHVARHPEELEGVGKHFLLQPDEAPAISTPERDVLWSMLRRQLRPAVETVEPDPRIERTLAMILDRVGDFRLTAERVPHIDMIRGFVLALSDCLVDLNAAAGLHDRQASVLRRAVLPGAFPVLELYLRRRLDLAARYLVSEWQKLAASLGMDLPGPQTATLEGRASLSAARHRHPMPSEHRLQWAFHTAVFQLLRSEEAHREGLEALIDLMTTLDLDARQAGQILEVSEETVRRWEREDEPLPQEITATLSEIQDALQRLKSMFLPERLPQVIRRPAELFGGDSALEQILQGRIREVADRYDLLLRYQA